jgi:hypothetical protein
MYVILLLIHQSQLISYSDRWAGVGDGDNLRGRTMR